MKKIITLSAIALALVSTVSAQSLKDLKKQAEEKLKTSKIGRAHV